MPSRRSAAARSCSGAAAGRKARSPPKPGPAVHIAMYVPNRVNRADPPRCALRTAPRVCTLRISCPLLDAHVRIRTAMDRLWLNASAAKHCLSNLRPGDEKYRGRRQQVLAACACAAIASGLALLHRAIWRRATGRNASGLNGHLSIPVSGRRSADFSLGMQTHGRRERPMPGCDGA